MQYGIAGRYGSFSHRPLDFGAHAMIEIRMVEMDPNFVLALFTMSLRDRL